MTATDLEQRIRVLEEQRQQMQRALTIVLEVLRLLTDQVFRE